MNAVLAFENRKDTLREQLEASENMPQAISAATMTLGTDLADLAQDEQGRFCPPAAASPSWRWPNAADERAGRWKRRPACWRRPRSSRAGFGAGGRRGRNLFGGAGGAGRRRQADLALLQALGALADALRRQRPADRDDEADPRMPRRRSPSMRKTWCARSAKSVRRRILLRGSSALIEQDNGPARLSGTADEAMLDLLSAMMEARFRQTGFGCAASIRLGSICACWACRACFTTRSMRALFDVLPARSGERTVRPLVRDGELVRRGVAAVAPMAKGGVSMKILGFDLGDGEGAVTLLDEDSTVEPRVLPLCGESNLLSAVGVKNGRIVIGEEASVTDGAAEAKVRFKSRYLTDPSASADVRAFAQGVMNELTRTQPR